MTAVYIHYPYCETLCPYCDFFSSTRPERTDFFRILQDDLTRWHQWLDEGPVQTLYFGGGTPSRMPMDGLKSVLETVGNLWGWPSSSSENAEITLEANPGDVTSEKLDSWRQLGVNRLSLGTQSFRDPELSLLGRRHNADQARVAASLIDQAGFSSHSLDLIFGLPGQSEDDLEESLDVLASLRPPHLSLYGLTIEPKTAFSTALHSGEFEELDRSLWLKMYQRVCQWAEVQGYHHYEISNFARSGHESRHNRGYWRNQSWVGAGPAAHGQRLTDRGLERRGHPRSVRAWAESVRSESSSFLAGGGLREELTLRDWFRERCMIGIRDLQWGIDPERWAAELGLDDQPILDVIDQARACGWVESDDPCRLSSSGLLQSDRVAGMILNA